MNARRLVLLLRRLVLLLRTHFPLEWIAFTVELFRMVAERMPYFTTDDVWDMWDRVLGGATSLPQYVIPESNNMRVMGNAVSAAIREGIIVKTWPSEVPGHPEGTMIGAMVRSRRNNGNNPLYRSLLYGSDT
jgi:hypothetical protein